MICVGHTARAIAKQAGVAKATRNTGLTVMLDNVFGVQ